MTQAALHLTIAALICLLAGGAPPHIFIAGLVLALLPDIDTPKSLVGSLLRPVSEAIERRVGHRTATHSLPAAVLPVAGLAYLLAPAWWGLLAACYASHVGVDLLIGRTGVRLFWPASEWVSVASWRDDGPAPRRLLLALLPLAALVGAWPQLAPGLSSPLWAAAAMANPIATATPTRTPPPSVSLVFELPPGVGLSALAVRAGDLVREGQALARWGAPAATPTARAAPPDPGPSPAPMVPAAVMPPPPADRSALALALADLAAAEAALPAERGALRLRQGRESAEALRRRDAAALALAQLQPAHEREQAERGRAVEVAAAERAAAQAELGRADGEARPRAEGALRDADAALGAALDAQARMRAEQGIARDRLQADRAAAQADLDALPGRQADEAAVLEARLAADLARARGRADAARGGLAADEARAGDGSARASATAAAQAAAADAELAASWGARATATAEAWATAAAATSAAAPTPWPTEAVARAAGRVARITAEERGGRLVVTVELTAL